MDTETLIIGGGLSGLALAAQLAASKRDFQLVEARDRFGGRIQTEQIGGGHFDLGPAWFWSGQPRIAAMIDRLGLTAFEQYADGEILFEDEQGNVQQGRGYASMQESLRLHGGLAALIDALRQELPQDRLHLSMPVVSLTKDATDIMARAATGETIKASQVVLALPMRLAASLTFKPGLPAAAIAAMTETATWMAGQAKAIAVYDRPFWRETGLSGDAMSRRGPMVEVHDASPMAGGPFALLGFIGVAPQHRSDAQALQDHVQAQLLRLFGKAAASPTALVIKDWAYDPFTSTQHDLRPLYAHPRYGIPRALENLWDGRLLFGGTEAAPQFGGYLEGALEAAENTVEMINATRPERCT